MGRCAFLIFSFCLSRAESCFGVSISYRDGMTSREAPPETLLPTLAVSHPTGCGTPGLVMVFWGHFWVIHHPKPGEQPLQTPPISQTFVLTSFVCREKEGADVNSAAWTLRLSSWPMGHHYPAALARQAVPKPLAWRTKAVSEQKRAAACTYPRL